MALLSASRTRIADLVIEPVLADAPVVYEIVTKHVDILVLIDAWELVHKNSLQITT